MTISDTVSADPAPVRRRLVQKPDLKSDSTQETAPDLLRNRSGEKGVLDTGALKGKMASGTAKYLRYILLTTFVWPSQSEFVSEQCANWDQFLVAIYFISSSKIPAATLPNTSDITSKWNAQKGSADYPTSSASSTEEEVAQASSLALSSETSSSAPQSKAPGTRVNATFVTLARNSDLWEIARSIRQIEDRFNRDYNYDWVFLNDKPFDDQFKKVTSSLISGKTHYGEIPEEHWSFPDFIDQDKARKVREDMAQRKIIYGDSVSYRHMCRFESGFFFRHPLMDQFDYYWRVEPSIELFCDIHYDPFKFMVDNKKKYSFVLSLYEYVETIPTLWDSTKAFMKKHPEHVAEGNSMGFLSDDGGDTYNHCHFVSISCPSILARLLICVSVVQFRDWGS